MVSTHPTSTMKETHLPVNGLCSAWLVQRLKQINKVRRHGVGVTIPPPRLVICGDQSSGKSSVLEHLTGIPFSLGNVGCTRFPIEVVFRHTNAPHPALIIASVQPHNERSPKIQHALRKYRRKLSDLFELPSVVEEVSTLIQVPCHTTTETDDTIATDILRIEFTASTVLDITVVDLPGLVSTSGDGQDVDEDRTRKALIERYLSRPHTIVLATLQATGDITNQSILQLMRKHDPNCQRTIGVLTKVDLIDPGTEQKNSDTTGSSFEPFLLIPSSETDSKVDFFHQETWKEVHLDKNRTGINNLKSFIQELMEEQIESELPKIQDQIKDKLDKVEGELRLLGNGRRTVGQIRSSLLDISIHFYQLAQAAHDGHYQGITGDFFSDRDNRLRLHVHTANEDFSKYMRDNGEKRMEVESLDKKSPSTQSTDEIYPEQLFVTAAEMMEWIKEKCVENRGRGLPGIPGQAPLADLFHEQSSRWPSIAKNHTHKVNKMVDMWVNKALAEVTRDDHLRRQILILFEKGLGETRKFAYDELEKLIDDESGEPITYNHVYEFKVWKFRDETDQVLKSLISEAVETGWSASKFLTPKKTEIIEKATNSVWGKTPAELSEIFLKDTKKALDTYYAIALRTFVDNVCRQVIERHFMKRLPTIFCPRTVAELSDEDLLQIGSEPRKQQKRRAQLEATAQSLRESLADLQKYPS
ncbi:putative dynamin GTPase [Annulohypoxylon moriforme]|nr:putative dynamin GTPase [Annulohypoxylon moriforme]